MPQSEELAQSLVQVIELLIPTLSPFLKVTMLSRCLLLIAIVFVVILCPLIKSFLIRLLPLHIIALENLLTICHPFLGLFVLTHKVSVNILLTVVLSDVCIAILFSKTCVLP